MDRRSRIIEIIERVSKKKVTIGDAESLFESGLMDSFALPDLVSGLEEAFGLTIPDSDLNPRKFDSLERIDEYLSSRV
jgi:acyl carrier protein